MTQQAAKRRAASVRIAGAAIESDPQGIWAWADHIDRQLERDRARMLRALTGVLLVAGVLVPSLETLAHSLF